MKILYFTRGLPTEAEKEEAEKAGALLRDRLAWHEGDCLEICDQVMGKAHNIPKPYRHLWRNMAESSSGEPIALPETVKQVKRSRIKKADANGSDN